MTHARVQKLRSTQRKMLRTILGKGRRPQLDTTISIESFSDAISIDSSSDEGCCSSMPSLLEEEATESWVSWIQRLMEELISLPELDLATKMVLQRLMITV